MEQHSNTALAQQERRRSTQASADPRAARTRQAILAAVHQLIAEGASAPTVSDIVRRSGVSRSSFYVQFANMDELARTIFRDAFSLIAMRDELLNSGRVLTPEVATRTAIAQLVAHVAEHRDFYRVMLSTTMARDDERVRAFAAQLEASIPIAASVPPGVSVDIASTYLAGGTVAILQSWIVGELAGTVEAITDALMALTPPWLSRRKTTHIDPPR